MPIPTQQAHDAIANLNTPEINNLIAQAHARHVLYEVKESRDNFPDFDPNLDEKTTFVAYALLAAACSLAEAGERAQGIIPLERAATLLQHVHGPLARDSRESGFHALISSMAFFAAGHYSRAFIGIRLVEEQTAAAKAIGRFLRKDRLLLIQQLNDILLRDEPTFDDQLELHEWAITIAIARAIAFVLEFELSGIKRMLKLADLQLQYALTLTTADGQSAWWWIVRLLRLMITDFDEASLWTVLPPYFDPDSFAMLERYIRILAFADRPVAELWVSQRLALPFAMDPKSGGAVISLRTSAGKTRVAELAILQTLSTHPAARIIYLAPFRSLALELEQTLGATLTWMGYTVSHLYGGSRVSSIDTELAAQSTITIATPEKVRALLRSEPELFSKVKLIVVDEGHMIGGSNRLIRNEIFMDHLRSLARMNKAKILLLSAVVPRPQELAKWLTGDDGQVASSTWKPSAERYGLLRWNGTRVKLEWVGDVQSFNPSFVEAGKLNFGGKSRVFPQNKGEAVAAAAVRLSSIGPVMLFTARAVSVPKLAEAVLLALGPEPVIHQWSEHEWQVFEQVCNEDLEPDAIELRAARVGVVCHSNRLTPQVRIAVEHLMRATPPRIIVATTTLAQGVNVGISSVIVANPYISSQTIEKSEFWNICGRAGRAFVDGEGKILYAIDDTRKPGEITKDIRLAREYFAASFLSQIESGLLISIRKLHAIAERAGVEFDVLIELAANNDFSILGDASIECESICDLLDDELLALHEDESLNPSAEDPAIWVERVFRTSLAVIQSNTNASYSEADDVLGFLAARVRSSLSQIATPNLRKSIVSSGLPLRIAIQCQRDLDIFRTIAVSYEAATDSLIVLCACLRVVEDWARDHGGSVVESIADTQSLDVVRQGWLNGTGLRDLSAVEPEMKTIASRLYGYQLPWIIHAASQQLRHLDELGRAESLARIALLVELGVPSEAAAHIFLAGVRSRRAATELANLGLSLGSNIMHIRRQLGDPNFAGTLQGRISEEATIWLKLLAAESTKRRDSIPEIPPFRLPGSFSTNILHARRLDDQIYLCSSDGSSRTIVVSTDTHPFDKVVDNPRICFIRSGRVWQLAVRDPRLPGYKSFHFSPETPGGYFAQAKHRVIGLIDDLIRLIKRG